MCESGSKIPLVLAIFGILVGAAGMGLGGYFAANIWLALPNYSWNHGCQNATAALAAYWDENFDNSNRSTFNLTVPALGPNQEQCFFFAAPLPVVSDGRYIRPNGDLPALRLSSAGQLGTYWASLSSDKPTPPLQRNGSSSDTYVCYQNELMFLKVVSNSTENLRDVVVPISVSAADTRCELHGLIAVVYVLLGVVGIVIFIAIVIFIISLVYIIWFVKNKRKDYNPL